MHPVSVTPSGWVHLENYGNKSAGKGAMMQKEFAAKPSGMAAASAANLNSKAPMPSIIGGGVLINGNLTSAGEIIVEGQIEGKIRGLSVMICDEAILTGDIIAEQVSVRGQVYGTIRAHHIVLGPKSHFEGTMVQETFAIEAGGCFQGSCRHSNTPLADDAVEVRTASNIENSGHQVGDHLDNHYLDAPHVNSGDQQQFDLIKWD
jgi:cytoskeletal protein CcmA (bactofilin family)